MDILEVNNLYKDYGDGRGVFDVSFKVKEGECFGFLGPNGAGKSTTIRHLMGFSKPDSGNTLIFGKETFNHYDEILSNVGYIPGEISLPQGLNGYEFISMMQDMYGIHNDEMLNKMLDLFELTKPNLEIDTKHMSLGVKRKLAIVCAFMSDPKVLILDEPTSGLDPIMQKKFIEFIIDEKKRGKTILLSSHIFSEVDQTCDRIAIIKDGSIVSLFDTNELKHAELKRYRIVFDSKEDYLKFNENYDKEIINIYKTNENKNKVFIECNDKNINTLISFLCDYKIKEFNHIKETLEDYFMKFYKEDKDFGGAL